MSRSDGFYEISLFDDEDDETLTEAPRFVPVSRGEERFYAPHFVPSRERLREDTAPPFIPLTATVSGPIAALRVII